MNFKDKNVWIHIVFIALIVIIAGVSAFRLYRWNKGTRNPEADIEQVDPSEFDTETMDMILPMDGSLLEVHEDDGELTILCRAVSYTHLDVYKRQGYLWVDQGSEE